MSDDEQGKPLVKKPQKNAKDEISTCGNFWTGRYPHLVISLVYIASFVVLLALVLTPTRMRQQSHAPVTMGILHYVNATDAASAVRQATDFGISDIKFLRYTRITFFPVLYIMCVVVGTMAVVHMIYFICTLEFNGKQSHNEYMRALSYPWKWVVCGTMMALATPCVASLIGLNTLAELMFVSVLTFGIHMQLFQHDVAYTDIQKMYLVDATGMSMKQLMAAAPAASGDKNTSEDYAALTKMWGYDALNIDSHRQSKQEDRVVPYNPEARIWVSAGWIGVTVLGLFAVLVTSVSFSGRQVHALLWTATFILVAYYVAVLVTALVILPVSKKQQTIGFRTLLKKATEAYLLADLLAHVYLLVAVNAVAWLAYSFFNDIL
jgi:hypothetical protein